MNTEKVTCTKITIGTILIPFGREPMKVGRIEKRRGVYLYYTTQGEFIVDVYGSQKVEKVIS